MNDRVARPPLDETTVRTRLQSALEQIEVDPRPVSELRRGALRRRRSRWLVFGGMGVAVAGAAAAAAVVLAGASPTGRPVDRVTPITQPSPVDAAAALHDYVAAHHGTSATGPVGSNGGTYAVDIETDKVMVLTFDGDSWSVAAELGSPLSGVPVVETRLGPAGAGDSVAFQIDTAGADAIFNGIIVSDAGSWRYADFDCNSVRVACAGGPGKATTWAVDGTEVDHVFHSEPNDCTPNCAAGTRYDVTWQWNPTYGTFTVASSVKMR